MQGAENHKVSVGPRSCSMHFRMPVTEAKSSSLVMGTTLQPLENLVFSCRREPGSQHPSTKTLSWSLLAKA